MLTPLGGFGVGAVVVAALGLTGRVEILPALVTGAGSGFIAARGLWKAVSSRWERRIFRLGEHVLRVAGPTSGVGPRA